MTPIFGVSSSSGRRPAGYFLGDYFGLEIDASMASPMAKAPGLWARDRAGSASLIVNSGGEHNISTCGRLYALPLGVIRRLLR